NAAGKMANEQPLGAGIAELDLSQATRQSLVGGTDHPISVTTTDDVHLRIVSVSNVNLRTGSPATGFVTQRVTVLVGLSTAEMDRILHQLIWLEVAIGAT